MKIFWTTLIFYLLYGCSSQKVLSFECNDIIKCEGDVYYEYTKEGFKTYHFVINKKEDIQELCKLVKKSSKISEISKPKKNATINLSLLYNNGVCKEIHYVNLVSGITQFTIMDACEGNKWVQGNFSNSELDNFFIEYFIRDGIDIGVVNEKFK